MYGRARRTGLRVAIAANNAVNSALSDTSVLVYILFIQHAITTDLSMNIKYVKLRAIAAGTAPTANQLLLTTQRTLP